MPRIVVVTGASGGIGRASAIAVRRRGRHRRAARPRRDGPGRRRRARSSRPAAPRTCMPVDVADAEQVFAAADQVEAELGPIDVWVNVAFTSVFAPFDQIKPEEYRRVTEVSYLGYVYGTMAALKHMKPARPRHDRAGRLGAGLPRHPAAVGLLRRQARHPGLPRGAALRAAAREEQRARHDGADAGREHPAVLLGAVPAAAPRPAGAADLPARVRRPRRAVRRRPPAPPRVLGRRQHRGHPGRERHRPGPAGPLPGRPASSPSRPRSRRTRTRRSTCGSRPTASDGRDFGAHGVFDAKSHRARPAAVGLPPPRRARACRWPAPPRPRPRLVGCGGGDDRGRGAAAARRRLLAGVSTSAQAAVLLAQPSDGRCRAAHRRPRRRAARPGSCASWAPGLAAQRQRR